MALALDAVSHSGVLKSSVLSKGGFWQNFPISSSAIDSSFKLNTTTSFSNLQTSRRKRIPPDCKQEVSGSSCLSSVLSLGGLLAFGVVAVALTHKPESALAPELFLVGGGRSPTHVEVIALVRDLIREVKAERNVPTAVWDIDGTLVNLRLRVERGIRLWAEEFQGPGKKWIRKIIRRAKPHQLQGWDPQIIFPELGITEPSIVAAAQCHHTAFLFSARALRKDVPIPTTVTLARNFQGMGVRNLFVTNRPVAMGGVTRTRLAALGVFREGLDHLALYDGRPIFYDAKTVLAHGIHEPNKGEVAIAYLDRLQNGVKFRPVFAADNAPGHANGLRAHLPPEVPVFHVTGDDPLGSPPCNPRLMVLDPTRL